MQRVILRLVHKRIEGPDESVLKVTTIAGSMEYRLDVYTVGYDSLIVQNPESPDAIIARVDRIGFADKPWTQYCRWHSGPLWERDDPSKRIYCTAAADGYCRQHRRSERALYEACVSLPGDRGLSACRILDSIGRTEYAVYITDGAAGGAKVGMTRLFRVVDRVAEQPHNVATIVYVVDSAYLARKAEISISKSGVASERRARSRRRLRGAAEAAAIVSGAAEKASRLLGTSWDGRLFRVTSPVERIVRGAREAGDSLRPGEYRILGYWGGYLALHGPMGPVVVGDRRIAHRDSIILYEGI